MPQPSRYSAACTLQALCLNCGDRNGVDDVLNGGTARQVVHGLTQTLQNRAHSGSTRRLLNSLVGVVTGVQVGEDEYGSLTSDLSLVDAMDMFEAASYWIGPSTAKSGFDARTSSVASRTTSTSAPAPEVPVE